MAQAVPGVDEFRGLVHEAARRTGGQVAGLTAADCVTPNFHHAVIAYRDRTVAVLCSRDDGSVAVTEPVDPGGCELVFLDEPELLAVVRQFERFRALSQDDVERPFDHAAHPHVWVSDVRYWRPETTGQALFHWWD
ncbi:hypothetical protein BBK82_08425 [Lentzea guizhouensis]|uniref:Uncharacterized protein n=1 Tax=Lentzea guizhouensis TaxID=1586287 RepID=A0A1B2HEE5_9PSEU|nr:hypothetical protein [Lentzea guizhouensis]ANZ36090.1 hypothetical protein BBK82_08425 [Lentzea guizhouensis]